MTLSTRVEIRHEALRRAGGFVEAVTSAPDASSVISDAMRYRFGGDDNGGVGMGIHEPSGAAADRLRVATTWDDSNGDATVDSLTSAMSVGDTVEYYLRNDPSPHEFNEAINRVLSETERVVESVLPTIEGSRHYSLLNAPWVETRRDILSVRHRESPNILDNSSFELWGRGTDAQLQGWTLSGTGGTASRVGGTNDRFALRVTRTESGTATLQSVPIPITHLRGLPITVFGRVRSGTEGMAHLRVEDGTDTVNSDRHSGGGGWEEITVTHTVHADAAGPLLVGPRLTVNAGNADYENVVAVQGTAVPDWLKKHGDQRPPTAAINATVQMRGSLPVIVTDRIYSANSQIVVQSRQPYFELTADSGAGGVTDLPLEAAVAGTLVKLAEVHSTGKPNAARWERLGAYWLPKYNAWKRMLREPSPSPAESRTVVGGV